MPIKDEVKEEDCRTNPPTLFIKDEKDCQALVSQVVAIISPQFPLDQLPILDTMIRTELKKPPEFQRFVLGNPEIFSELQKKRESFVTRAQELDDKITNYTAIIRLLEKAKSKLENVGCPVRGSILQIEIMASAIEDVRRARLNLQREYGM